jgi:hypothetical protein
MLFLFPVFLGTFLQKKINLEYDEFLRILIVYLIELSIICKV